MNKNQVNGTVKDLTGKVQEEAGKLVGNKEQQAKGLIKQAEGKSESIIISKRKCKVFPLC